MLKRLHFAFTGVVVLAPGYPGPGRPETPGPIYVLMPNSPRVRRFPAFDLEDPARTADVSAHIAFAVFPYENLITTPGYRGADYKYPTELIVDKGVSFLHREALSIYPPPMNTTVIYVEGDTSGVPDQNAIAAGWIADWKKFAPSGDEEFPSMGHFYEAALFGEGDFIRLELPGGVISSRFACQPPPKAFFAYGDLGNPPASRFFAHEIVVTMTFGETNTNFTLRSKPFAGSEDGPTDLSFEWGDATEMRITFANGAVASMENVLSGSCAGHDHEGRADHEFQLLYKDVIYCPEDADGRKPVPVITSREILRIPCLSSTIEVDYVKQPELTLVNPRRVSSGQRDAGSAGIENRSYGDAGSSRSSRGSSRSSSGKLRK